MSTLLKNEFDRILDKGVSPIFVINDRELYVNYVGNTLFCGGATNVGVINEYSIEYDDTCSFDDNLNCLYNLVIEEENNI